MQSRIVTSRLITRSPSIDTKPKLIKPPFRFISATAAQKSPSPPEDVNDAERSPTPTNAQIDGDFAIFPAEIIREIVSHAMVTGFTFDSTPTYWRGDNKRTLGIAHISQRFRQATLSNPGNFCTITLKRPQECYSHSNRQIRFLSFILSLARRHPLNLTIQLLSSPDNSYDLPIPHVRDTLCSCLDNVMERSLGSLTITASQYPTITNFIVTNLTFNKAMFSQPSLTYIEIEVDERIKGWDAMRLLDALATRRLSCHVSLRLGHWIPHGPTFLKASLPLVQSLSLTGCPQGFYHSLRPFSHVQTLDLHDTISPLHPLRFPTQKIHLEQLKSFTLVVQGTPSDSLCVLLQQIVAINLKSMSLHWVHDTHIMSQRFGDALEDFLTVADSYDSLCTFKFVERGPWESIVLLHETGPMKLSLFTQRMQDRIQTNTPFSYKWTTDQIIV
ncbi:hypothetical protein VNI00_012601 [Paramarasmius palmivorus]|uniref:F-box domain-containing protein n=1 Tax=Paramarasmius palmivorus TaxID=297713 RepID=A0AAW0C477_9AGAR